MSGVKLSIRGDPVFPQWGLSDCIVGKVGPPPLFADCPTPSPVFQLGMTDEQLETNIESIVRAVCTHRNPALGPFINRAILMTVPGNEHYALKVDQWCPQATAEQVNKVSVVCGLPQ